MNKVLVSVSCAAALAVCPAARAQNEGLTPTQALVVVQGHAAAPQQVTVQVDGKNAPVSSFQPLSPATTQVALLIDDGLRESIGRSLNEIKSFLTGLPPGVQVLVGYMENGTVRVAQPFTTDHQAATAAVRLPTGIPGESASPYFCLSEFAKHWPGEAEPANAGPQIARGNMQQAAPARIVLMISNGVDPYNGSTSVLNQDSPYVQQAVTDAQKAGVLVYTLYFSDAGIRGGSANLSGQSYLQQVAESTGGENLYQGTWNAPSLYPYFNRFTESLGRTYVVTFGAPEREGRDNLMRLKVSAQGAKVHAPTEVAPGNRE